MEVGAAPLDRVPGASGPVLSRPEPDTGAGSSAGLAEGLERIRARVDTWRDRPWLAGGIGVLLVAVVVTGWWLGRPPAARSIEDGIPYASGASIPGGGAADGASASAAGSRRAPPGSPSSTAVSTGSPAGSPVSSGNGSNGPGSATVSGPAAPVTGLPGGPGSAVLVVHVAGAVQRPGIVNLAQGSRVTDAVEAAGGPASEADLDQLNLAAPLSDGMQIRVPRKGEAASPPVGPPLAGATPGTATGPLDLNRATVDQLDQLPGIGPSLAAAVVAYRDRHGRFARVGDLLQVPGIGPAKLALLTPHVKV